MGSVLDLAFLGMGKNSTVQGHSALPVPGTALAVPKHLMQEELGSNLAWFSDVRARQSGDTGSGLSRALSETAQPEWPEHHNVCLITSRMLC